MDARVARFRANLGALLIGTITGVFAALIALLTVVPLDLMIWLVAITIGAVGGFGYAVCFILSFRAATRIDPADVNSR
jgi:hypothetical protein